MEFIHVNEKIIRSAKAFIEPADHSYRYGHGLFETMKIMDGKILLASLHFERLFNGLSVLKIQNSTLFTQQILEKQIIDLCKKNNCERLARVRLSISGGEGGLYDDTGKLNYIIECWPLLSPVNKLNENGLLIDIFPDAKKSCDVFSNLKSASHLSYVMGAKFAKENKLNDCLVLNMYNRICDSTIANIFWITGDQIYTPALSEGCIAGVMRKYLIEKLRATSYKLQERCCEIPDLENADEVFLTNAIQGIKWVKEFRNKEYVNILTKEIYSII
jgi:branched-chain amino acid aminotransferase